MSTFGSASMPKPNFACEPVGHAISLLSHSSEFSVSKVPANGDSAAVLANVEVSAMP
jgi:hypothetical protein